MADEKVLTLSHIVGFNGKLPGGAVAHPDGERMLYAVGGSLVLKGLDKGTNQALLTRPGSADEICCLAISRTGRLAASAHRPRGAIGARSDIIVWNLDTQSLVHTLSLHVGAVASLSFSPDERYLVSLGADDNRIAVWDAEDGKAVCGAPASREREGKAKVVVFLPSQGKLSFISSGENTMRVWEFDTQGKKIEPNEVAMGSGLKRIVTCAVLSPSGEVAYCGTTTGDILHIDVAHRVFKSSGPVNKKDVPLIEQGVLSLSLSGEFLFAGSGSGNVYKVDPAAWVIRKKVLLDGSATSLSRVAGGGFVCGTSSNKLFYLDNDLSSQLLLSAPYAAVNDIGFPNDYSDLYVACSANTVTVWNSETAEELLHIEDPNKSLVCNCVAVPKDGKSIISGWSDGKVRAYTPETGKFLYTIENAHHGPVTDIVVSSDSKFMVTGGTDGEVRVWRLGRESRVLESSMKEHKSGVTSLSLSKDNLRCLSSSMDGTCLIWDLARKVSVKSFFGTASVLHADWDSTEANVIAVGSEKKVIVYEVSSGIRMNEFTAANMALTSVASAPDGGNIATGSEDLCVKVWNLSGALVSVGHGHSGPVTRVEYAPDGSFIISAGDNGAIYTWRL